MRYPDFIGIGAQKAGTTWLSRNLQTHPQVWMPVIKELHYFNERINDPARLLPRLSKKILGRRVVDRRWRRQVRSRIRRHRKGSSREALRWDLKYYLGRPGDAWYASLFEPGAGKVTGEITPAYSTLGAEAVGRIHGLMPEAKAIFMMRNPVERAWSQAVMWFSKVGKKNVDSISLKKLHRSFESEGSRLRTDYLRTLETWGKYYPPERIFVGFLEDVHFFPEELLERVYGFLGVDPSFKPPGIGRKVHARSSGRVPAEAVTSLARIHLEEAARLSESFGGYAAFWRHSAERLIEDPPREETVPYPLWESELWREWRETNEVGLQSGALPSVRGG